MFSFAFLGLCRLKWRPFALDYTEPSPAPEGFDPTLRGKDTEAHEEHANQFLLANYEAVRDSYVASHRSPPMDEGKPFIVDGAAHPRSLEEHSDWYDLWHSQSRNLYHRLCVACAKCAEVRTILTSHARTMDGKGAWDELKSVSLGQASGESAEGLLLK